MIPISRNTQKQRKGGLDSERWNRKRMGSYLDKMEKYGLSDYLAIKQKYFDQYQESLSEEK